MAANHQIDSLTYGLYHPETRASPRRPRGALVPTQHKSPTIEDDLAFEWLLCLASTVEASRRLRLPEASEPQRHEEFPHCENRNLAQTNGKKAVKPTEKES